MFYKVVVLCALVAVSQAGLLAAPVHYSPSEAVSSQSIVRHDESAMLAVAAPVDYHATPTAVAYHAAPAVAYQAVPAAVSYHAAPVQYSSAAAVSSQNIIRHDQPQVAKFVAPIAKVSFAAPVVAYQAAPAAVAYHAAPTVVYHTALTISYHAAPVIAAHEPDAPAKYEYTYSVADDHTGDNKSQQESRDGDVVKGSYSFHEADGSIRTVEYSAEAHSGFNAVVHNTAPNAAPALIKTHAYAAPAAYYH